MNLRSGLFCVLVLVLGICCGQRGEAAQPSKIESETSDAAAIAARDLDASAVNRLLTNNLNALTQGQPQASSDSHPIFWSCAALVLLGMLAMVRYMPRLALFSDEHEKARFAAAKAAAQVPAAMLDEHKSFSEFANCFRVGPRKGQSTLSEVRAELPAAKPLVQEPAPPAAPQKAFATESPKYLAALQEILLRIGRATEEPTRKKLMADLHQETAAFRAIANRPDLLPVWQMACALEALLKQLADKPANITPSTLRTVAGAGDLLTALTRAGVRKDLISSPPIRVLAVDDDAISRHAVSYALKKALNLPDLADQGHAALELARENTYDAIFLDVQMPGMDGFELCQKIHETPLNQKTPVVFITCQSDFNARAKSALIGGHDLIGKPFLTFEVTVKALTLILRRRLQNQTSPAKATPQVESLAAVPA